VARLTGFEAWFQGVAQDFDFNIIQGDRYKMLLDGLCVTAKVALAAALLGVLLGSLIALMRLSNWRVGRMYPLRAISSAYVDVIRGTPVVTQLLIMNFIILLSYRGPKEVVAILTFGLNSAAYVSEMVRGGILAIDKGQTEAGRSLGLSASSTMALIVMPQAIKVIVPSLFNEFVMLLKETSVVGFIGLMDLTKAGDYIRSRTFSAFFPLITVAVVYFVIISVLTRVFNRLERRLRQGDTH
jgi:polar amino acid transport system permease protein/polar amino acid transport system substrate-binding protein